jgi:hypothetical protein
MTTTGWERRLAILRRDVETQILSPLRTHGWVAQIVSEVEKGEYVLVEASRGEAQRRCAVLYSTAVANSVYKQLDQRVDHIFSHGEIYKLDSYAYGITTPVTTAGEFQSILVTWNAASAPGKFIPDAAPAVPAGPEERRLLLAEAPIEAIWLRIKQLQSVTLAKKLVAERARRVGASLTDDVISSKAEGVAYALRNAADYFHAHDSRNVSQRVLNLYYGTLSFAFAEMLAMPAGPSTLGDIEDSTKQGHGLFTVDGLGAGLGHLVVGPIASGFFPAWVKAAALGTGNYPAKKPRTPQDAAALAVNSRATVAELFARIPEVDDLFVEVFDDAPAWIHPEYDHEANSGGSPMARHRAKPTRTYARLVDASARLTKDDIPLFPGPIGEIADVSAGSERGRQFRVSVDHAGLETWWDALPLHHSPFERVALIRPLFGDVLAYRTICFVLLYALSIVVRYRPSVWRRVQEGDHDHVRVLVEAFLSVVDRVLPDQFLGAVTARKIAARQPGGLF